MDANRWKAVALLAIAWAVLATAVAWNNARTVDHVTRQLTDAKREAAAAVPTPDPVPPSPIREARRVQAVRDEPGTRCVDGIRFRVSGGTVEQLGPC